MTVSARRLEALGYIGLVASALPEDVTGGLIEVIPVLPTGWRDPKPRNTFISLDAPTGPVLRPGWGDYFVAPNQPELLPSPRLSRFTPLVRVKTRDRNAPPRYKEAEKGFFVPNDWTRDEAWLPVIRATQAVTAALLRAPNAVLVLQAIPFLAFWGLRVSDNVDREEAVWRNDTEMRAINAKHLKARTEARIYGDPLAAALTQAISALYPQDTVEIPVIGEWRAAVRQGFGRVPAATEAMRTFDAAPAMLTPSDPVLQAAIPKDVRALPGLATLWGKKEENEWAWYAPVRRAVWDGVPYVSDNRYSLREEEAAWLLKHTPLGRVRSTPLPAPWQAKEGELWQVLKVDTKVVDQGVMGRPYDFGVELRLVGYTREDSKQVLVFQTQAGRPLYLDVNLVALVLGALRFWTPGFRDRLSWRIKPENRPRHGSGSKSILDPVLLSNEAGTPFAILMPLRLD